MDWAIKVGLLIFVTRYCAALMENDDQCSEVAVNMFLFWYLLFIFKVMLNLQLLIQRTMWIVGWYSLLCYSYWTLIRELCQITMNFYTAYQLIQLATFSIVNFVCEQFCEKRNKNDIAQQFQYITSFLWLVSVSPLWVNDNLITGQHVKNSFHFECPINDPLQLKWQNKALNALIGAIE